MERGIIFRIAIVALLAGLTGGLLGGLLIQSPGAAGKTPAHDPFGRPRTQEEGGAGWIHPQLEDLIFS